MTKTYGGAVSGILLLAQKVSQSRLVDSVASDHLLLAVLHSEDVAICSLLNERGVTVQSVTAEVDAILSVARARRGVRLSTEPTDPDLVIEPEKIDAAGILVAVAPIAKFVVDSGMQLAKKHGHLEVMPTDLLLAICFCPDCFANKVLENLGVNVAELVVALGG